MALGIETCVGRHIGDRKEQQDRVSIIAHPEYPGTIMAVLADGMGGHSGGAMAAEQVMLKAAQNFEMFAPGSETPREFLRNIILDAHITIRLTRFTSEKDPHSTAVLLLVQPDRIDWAHCGDSRLYWFRGSNLQARTEDHSLVGQLQRKGKLTEKEALEHPQRNVLLSCLGSEREPEIIFSHSCPPEIGDSFLLCSDGLWAYFSDKELGQILSTLTAREAARKLIQLARDRADGSGDNITVAIVKLVEGKRIEHKPPPKHIPRVI